MKQRFTVEGMSCAACSASVEKAVNRLDFVNSAQVNLLAKSMICDFEGGKEQEEAIIKAGVDFVELDENRILCVFSANQSFLMIMDYWNSSLDKNSDSQYLKHYVKSKGIRK